MRKVNTQSIRLRGYRLADGTVRVMIDKRELSPARSQQIRNHSPDGFDWGYTGSGPSQLALAVLLETIEDREAFRLYHQFKNEVIAPLRQDQPDSKEPAFDIQIDIATWYNHTVHGRGLSREHFVKDLLLQPVDAPQKNVDQQPQEL